MNIELLKPLLGRYAEFKDSTTELLFNEQQARMKPLISGYNELKPRLQNIEKAEAGRFNIFEIMKIRYSEVRVHTPIIAELLNPTGVHGQSDLFLKKFIEMFLSDSPGFHSYHIEQVSVADEVSTLFGRLDILVRSQNGSNSFAFVIENKIHARDQADQLKRYKEYLDNLRFIPTSNIRLFYLTLSGNDPCEFSIHKELYSELKNKGIIKCLSYRYDIISWLSGCLTSVESDKVNYSLTQYITILKAITNG